MGTPDALTIFNEGDQVFLVDDPTKPPKGPYVVASGPPYQRSVADMTTGVATRLIPLLNPDTGETFTANSFELVKSEDYHQRGKATPP
jgi:hypothetical protein